MPRAKKRSAPKPMGVQDRISLLHGRLTAKGKMSPEVFAGKTDVVIMATSGATFYCHFYTTQEKICYDPGLLTGAPDQDLKLVEIPGFNYVGSARLTKEIAGLVNIISLVEKAAVIIETGHFGLNNQPYFS